MKTQTYMTPMGERICAITGTLTEKVTQEGRCAMTRYIGYHQITSPTGESILVDEALYCDYGKQGISRSFTRHSECKVTSPEVANRHEEICALADAIRWRQRKMDS